MVDYGYRAIHETAEKSKAIVTAFYGDAPKRTYFSSCSNGGRQALMEAQRYPADYDGIIAGAPANYFTITWLALRGTRQCVSRRRLYSSGQIEDHRIGSAGQLADQTTA